jgi:hypothetical protein
MIFPRGTIRVTCIYFIAELNPFSIIIHCMNDAHTNSISQNGISAKRHITKRRSLKRQKQKTAEGTKRYQHKTAHCKLKTVYVIQIFIDV